MRSAKLTFIYFLCAFTITYSQIKISAAKFIDERNSATKDYVIDGQFAMHNFYERNKIDPIAEVRNYPVLKKTMSWNFTVGSKKTWWAADERSTPSNLPFYQVSSTCRAVGTHCYVFVEDASWNVYVDSIAVTAIVNAFDNANATGTKGIYQTDIDVFGSPPDVDNDPKIIILILDIKDDYTPPSGGYVAGFFSPTNETSGTYSNQAEMYYMDCNPADLMNKKTSHGLSTALGTCAHEFQHMIHYNYQHGSDQGFFDEGCSMVAEVLNGYNIDSYYSYYAQTPNRYLLFWNYKDANDVLNDYGRAANFFLYIKEQFYDSNNQFFKRLVQSIYNGIHAFDFDALPFVGTPRRFADILVDWWIANYLNDTSVNPKWGFKYSNVPQPTSASILNPNVPNTSSSINKQAALYLSYVSGKNLSINFNTQGRTGIIIKAIKLGTSSKQVADVTQGTNFTVPDFGTTFPKVIFLVCHNDDNDFVYPANPTPFPFSYTSTGTAVLTVQEIAYDTSEPTGVFAWSAGDTMAVRFDGVSGMKLDSIRVAVRNTVSMEGGIWRAGTSKFLGARLVTFNIAGKTIPPAPYPVPWPNWVTYDVRSYNIDAGSSFIVAFPVKGKYTSSTGAFNNVMITPKKMTTAYHSYTYLISSDASSGTPGWYFISSSDTTIALYLIRAYVSNTFSDVGKVTELLPSSFKLEQNYPNPFNPSTNISYKLQGTSYTTLKVYDMLGREVSTLVNKEQPAGKYQIVWNGTDNFGNKVTSGVYFYTIKAGSYVETKKMILMK